MNIHSPSLSDREKNLILGHAERELAYALELKARGNYEDAAAALRKVADRYETLAGEK